MAKSRKVQRPVQSRSTAAALSDISGKPSGKPEQDPIENQKELSKKLRVRISASTLQKVKTIVSNAQNSGLTEERYVNSASLIRASLEWVKNSEMHGKNPELRDTEGDVKYTSFIIPQSIFKWFNSKPNGLRTKFLEGVIHSYINEGCP